jgi:hypothetical protein
MYRAGDRLSSCSAGMRPIGLTLKDIGLDRWGKEQKGELMLVHECVKCGKFSINRIASDDKSDELIKIFEFGLDVNTNQKAKLKSSNIKIAEEKDREEIKKQLFGK